MYATKYSTIKTLKQCGISISHTRLNLPFQTTITISKCYLFHNVLTTTQNNSDKITLCILQQQQSVQQQQQMTNSQNETTFTYNAKNLNHTINVFPTQVSSKSNQNGLYLQQNSTWNQKSHLTFCGRMPSAYKASFENLCKV